MMKRMMAAIAFLGVSMASFAQETVPVQKYSVATNSFWSNWFIQIGGDYNAWYSNQEHGLGLDNGKHYSLFAKQRRTFSGSIAVESGFLQASVCVQSYRLVMQRKWELPMFPH